MKLNIFAGSSVQVLLNTNDNYKKKIYVHENNLMIPLEIEKKIEFFVFFFVFCQILSLFFTKKKFICIEPGNVLHASYCKR
jgi:hypothetical protein